MNIKFGKNVYENVSVNHLKPLKMEAHGHPAADKDEDDKKKKTEEKNIKEITINGKRYRPI